MGRKRKVRGKLLRGKDGGEVRVISGYLKSPHQYIFGKRGPRGKTGAAWEFTTFLKERAPLLYVFIVGELRKSSSERDPKLEKIIKEWRQDAAQTRPNSRELTAYVFERDQGRVDN